MQFGQHKRLFLVFSLLLIVGVFVAVNSLPQKENSSIENSINSAAVLIKDGSPEEGLKAMRAIAEQHPDNPKAFFLIAWWLEGLAMDRSGHIKDPDMQQEALRHMKTAVALAPDNVTYRTFYARMLVDVTEDDGWANEEAIRQYETAFQQIDRTSAKDSEDVRFAVGLYSELMVYLDRRDDAEKEVQLWLEPSGFHEEIYGQYVYVVSLRSFEEGRKLVDRYFRERGFNQRVLTTLCVGQYDRKYFEEARGCFEKVRDSATDRVFRKYAERMIREIDSGLENEVDVRRK
jgi:tetratricopeptide (TPR) repeat protein